MKKVLIAIVTLCSVVTAARAQVASTCVQTLRLAQSTYENGRLHELPTLLKSCLDVGFTKEEKRQAYKLLAQSYIYLEEPEQADEAMLNLLKTDHFFRPNTDVDPAEFISLWSKFRSDPLFRVGFKLGPSFNSASPITDYFVGSDSRGTAKYSPDFGFFIGLVFEKDFLKDQQLTLAPELNYTTRGYGESSDQFHYDKNRDSVNADLIGAIKYSWIEFNPIVKYRLNSKEGDLQLYGFAGPGINFMTKATLPDNKFDRKDGAGTVTGAEVDTKESFKKVNFSAIAGIGARFRLGGIYVTSDIRLQYGISNLVNPSSRINAEAAFDYGYITNDVRLTSVVATLGIQYAIFNPKKLIK